MALHVEPIVATARWYSGADAQSAFDAFEPFEACATLQWAGPDEVLISALRVDGRLSLRFRSELRDWLLAQGVRRLVYLRRGRRVVREVE